MTQASGTSLPTLIRAHEARILSDWIAAQLQSIRHAKKQANREQKYWHDIGSPAVRHAHGEERYCGSRGRCCGSRILRDT